MSTSKAFHLKFRRFFSAYVRWFAKQHHLLKKSSVTGCRRSNKTEYLSTSQHSRVTLAFIRRSLETKASRKPLRLTPVRKGIFDSPSPSRSHTISLLESPRCESSKIQPR